MSSRIFISLSDKDVLMAIDKLLLSVEQRLSSGAPAALLQPSRSHCTTTVRCCATAAAAAAAAAAARSYQTWAACEIQVD